MSVVFTDEIMRFHSGPNGSMEHPGRLFTNWSNAVRVNSATFDSYLRYVYLVHSVFYLQSLFERCKNTGIFRWGCIYCSYINTYGDTCEMCFSRKTDSRWEYLEMIRGDTTYINFFTPEALKAAVVSACELAISLAQERIRSGFAIIRPPGHHASRDIGQGFCLLNNTAIAAEAALQNGTSQIFIFDWDLHHGNGLQDQFYARKDVFYCSMHAEGIYPHTGRSDEYGIGEGFGYNLNLPLPKGMTDETYFEIFILKVIPALREYNPDLVLIAAGFDGLASDPMGIFSLTPELYPRMINEITKVCPRIGLILEGGYDPAGIEKSIRLCLQVL